MSACKIMSFGHVAELFDSNDSMNEIKKNWNSSQTEYTEDKLHFLNKSFIYKMNEFLKLPSDAINAFLRTVNCIKNNDILKRLIWHLYFLLFCSENYPMESVKKWPVLKNCNKEVSDMFHAIIAISGIPDMQKIYRQYGIPDEVLIDTLDFIKVWMKDHYRKYGRWGFYKLYWFRYYQLKGILFRLGRLEYETALFNDNIKVYRNLKNNKVTALCEPDISFRSDGQVNGTNNIFDKTNGWVSKLTEKGNHIIGNPVHPSGYAISKRISLSLKEWKPVLSKGDPVLKIHIPAKGKLTPQLCKESYKKALNFFAEYFPENRFSAFYCGTWFLDPQFQKILPSYSNIAKFQKDFYLYPVLTSDIHMFKWVFGGKPDDLSKLPRETCLHRAIFSHYENGNRMRRGTGFILISDITWGQDVYDFTPY